MDSEQIRYVANWCREYLELQHSTDVGAAFGELMDAFAEIARLSGGNGGAADADQFERLKVLEQQIDEQFTALTAAHELSLQHRKALVDSRSPRTDGRALLFVYGTLKRGHSRCHYLSAQRFVGPAVTEPRYRLYNCGDYPALVHDPNGVCIQGELWEIDASCRARLDEVEGVSQKLYAREPISLKRPTDAGEVDSYIYLRSVRGLSACGTRWP